MPLYQMAEQKLREMLLEPDYASGCPLPPENELARTLNISRVTIRKAMDRLMEDRLIVRVRGKGTFARINKPAGAQPSSPTARLVGTIMPMLAAQHEMQILHGIESALAEKGFYTVVA